MANVKRLESNDHSLVFRAKCSKFSVTFLQVFSSSLSCLMKSVRLKCGSLIKNVVRNKGDFDKVLI